MAHLTVTQRIEILIFIGCGNKTRTQQEVCNLFNAKYPDNPITRSKKLVMIKIYQNSTKERPKITHDKTIGIVLSMEENPQSTSTVL
ncbi:hypothetical protein NQ318_023663 [Aromia moschata]|uniref:DUF4817 domain-containing protein n=1 Tax=Aromia moschata TaxID=1265417 RepID=A0AAV8XRL3_9CUCU|nr:hypothetical protein NQ318_023663 [Aromia moschata]